MIPSSIEESDLRCRKRNQSNVRPDGDFVLYWMTANRRTTWNYSLDRALEWSQELSKPLLILEAVRSDYRWASDRLHAFMLQGMKDNSHHLAKTDIAYYPYVEPAKNRGKGLLSALAARSCVVVTDDFPCFFLPRMVESAAAKLGVLLESVDSNGLLPLSATEKVFPTAFAFRRYLQEELPLHLPFHPSKDLPKRGSLPRLTVIPKKISDQWPLATGELLNATPSALASLEIDHSVHPVNLPGGSRAASSRLQTFLGEKLTHYASDRNRPDRDGSSGLSPYLHFGHISSHEVFHRLAEHENWNQERLSRKRSGKRQGWWGMSEAAEAFLDQLVTWREVGYNHSSKRDDYDLYESLPTWARITLEDHEADPREYVYDLQQFSAAKTHDSLWNAAQTQLVQEGEIHNYLRMLWGKKILEWTRSPREALSVMIELNNTYALDGRNPNSYSGIFWVLGRYDRAWGPVRNVFGKIRFMSSDNTARKLRVGAYMDRYNLGETEVARAHSVGEETA